MEPKEQQSDKDKNNSPIQRNGKEPASLASRIASSASGLAKDLVGSSSANDFSSQRASGSGLSSKLPNGSSSTSQSIWNENIPSHAREPAANRLSSNGHNLTPEGNFRSTSFQDVADKEINAFLEGNSSYPQNSLSNGHDDSLSWAGEFGGGLRRGQHPNGGDSQRYDIPRGFANDNYDQQADYDDGTEVRMLLSDPNFAADNDPMDSTMSAPVEETVADLFGGEYSPDEKRAADRILSSLPPPPVYKGVSSDNPLNLRPEFAPLAATDAQLRQDILELSSTFGSEDESLMYSANTPQRERWISEWDDVLNRYTDEVWGDILPAVKEARSQLQEVKAGSEKLDNKAVSRLRMILGHVVHQGPCIIQKPVQDSGQGEIWQSLGGSTHMTFGASAHAGFREGPLSVHAGSKEAEIQTFEHPIQSERLNDMNMQNSHRIERHIRKDSPMAERERNEEISTPAFHCPWISCHQRFNNANELRLHTSTHTQYACPHEDCTAKFQSHEDWTTHIEGPHHDLLDSGFRSRFE
ncbi:hypothetical protein K432DRAFT_352537 [Lepidopterella palustris CBS 459.81]|uniref:C2H2-type domain-containing protein n=1 Tax=Lepidopterella palustris CBS 459.81 TaxID=1314670 RepID=A0A8E2EB27_9PEZI|nr:hypothetical protein K432DRAFT_352537 [Lepidopterella palustris CBS 459.81]